MTEKANEKETLPMKRPTTEIMPDVQALRLLATDLANSRLFPNVASVPGAVAIIEYGRELGVPPVAALQSMAVIKGKLTMESKMMLALANQKANVTWLVKETTKKVCRIVFKRPGFDNYESVFTIEEAEQAGLASKDNYKNYAEDMLFARAASRGVKRIAPDAILGLYSREEMEDFAYIESGKSESVQPPIETKVIETDEFIHEPPKPEVKESKEPEKPQEPAVQEQSDFVFMSDEDKGETIEPSVDKEKEQLVESIKKSLELIGVSDIKDFKKWLADYQKKIGRVYVGDKFGNLSLSEGNKEDLYRLFQQINFAAEAYQKARAKVKSGNKKS